MYFINRHDAFVRMCAECVGILCHWATVNRNAPVSLPPLLKKGATNGALQSNGVKGHVVPIFSGFSMGG